MTRPIRDTDSFAPNTLLIPNTPVGPLNADKWNIYGGLVLPEKTDFAVACTYASNNGLIVICRFDVVLVSTVL